MSIVIYTAITSGYDALQRQMHVRGMARFEAFVERGTVPVPPWNLRELPPWPGDPCRRAKRPKVLAHEFIDADFSLWIDGCVMFRNGFSLEALMTELGDHDLGIFPHPSRDCLYDEAEAVGDGVLERRELVRQQTAFYKMMDFPKHAGLAEAHLILRRHTPAVERFNQIWWHEIERWSRRDQVSFPYAAREAGLSYTMFQRSHLSTIRRFPHRGPRTTPVTR